MNAFRRHKVVIIEQWISDPYVFCEPNAPRQVDLVWDLPGSDHITDCAGFDGSCDFLYKPWVNWAVEALSGYCHLVCDNAYAFRHCDMRSTAAFDLNFELEISVAFYVADSDSLGSAAERRQGHFDRVRFDSSARLPFHFDFEVNFDCCAHLIHYLECGCIVAG